MANTDVVKIKSVNYPAVPGSGLLVKLKNDYISDFSNFDVDVYADKTDSSNAVLIASNSGVVYTGQPENKDDASCQNFLLVVNRKKKRAKLISTRLCNLSEIDVKAGEKLEELTDYRSKTALLTNKFGSKRSRRHHDLTNKMRVNPGACEELLKPILDETHVDESYLADLDDGTGSLERFIPPCNRTASVPQSVYNVNDLMTENERSSLEEAAQYVIDIPPSDSDAEYSAFFLSHYKLISNNISSDKLILLFYADCLLRLLKIHSRELKNRDSWNKVSPYSKMIASKLRKEFTDVKLVTTQMRHKAACYALVSIVLACNFKVHLDLISSCFFGIDHRKLLQLCRLVGLSVYSASSSDVLVLKLPLPPLPTANKSPKKKKRR